MDGSGNAIAAWVSAHDADAHYAVLAAGGGWGPDQTLTSSFDQGHAHSLSLAVSPDGSVIVAFSGGLNATLGRLRHHHGRVLRPGPGSHRR